MHWTQRYIGIPWLLGGREPGVGLDCWGIIRYVYSTEYGVPIKEHANVNADEHGLVMELVKEELAGDWSEVQVPQEGDAVLLGRDSTFNHVGLYVEIDGRPALLHAQVNTTSNIQYIRHIRSKGWSNLKYYRHALRR